jgi:hypothetical protein
MLVKNSMNNAGGKAAKFYLNTHGSRILETNLKSFHVSVSSSTISKDKKKKIHTTKKTWSLTLSIVQLLCEDLKLYKN